MFKFFRRTATKLIEDVSICACFLLLPFTFVGLANAEPQGSLSVISEKAELKQASLVSGNWIVGIHIDAERNKRVPTLYSKFPGGWGDGEVCARATNINGRYTFFGEYEFEKRFGGLLVDLPYSKEYRNIVRSLNSSNSGIAIHKGGCKVVSTEFVPALWNSDERPRLTQSGNLKLLINLNSQRSQQVFARGTIEDESNGKSVRAANCLPYEGGGIAFNFRCEIEVPTGTRGIMLFEVWQVQSGVVADPKSAKIYLQPYKQ